MRKNNQQINPLKEKKLTLNFRNFKPELQVRYNAPQTEHTKVDKIPLNFRQSLSKDRRKESKMTQSSQFEKPKPIVNSTRDEIVSNIWKSIKNHSNRLSTPKFCSIDFSKGKNVVYQNLLKIQKPLKSDIPFIRNTVGEKQTNNKLKLIPELLLNNITPQQFFQIVQKNELKRVERILQRQTDDIKSLIELRITDKDGSNIIHYSVFNQLDCLVDFLIKIHADFNIRNNNNVTPLMVSCMKHQTGSQIFKKILNLTENSINWQDNSGYTALHFASLTNNGFLVKKLLSIESCDPNILNFDHKTFLDLSSNKSKMMVLLQQRNLNQEQSDQQGNKRKRISINSELLQNKFSQLKTNPKQAHIQHQKVNIKDFVIHSQIGQGSFGSIYLVQHKNSQILYSLKVIGKDSVQQNELKDYLYTERKIMSQINHPFLLKLHYCFQSKENVYFITDFLPGRDLSYYVAKQNKRILSEKNIKYLVGEVILALETLHWHNIIYWDLKPENVLLDCAGHARLIDFGLAKEKIQSIRTGGTSFCGSHSYLAPEMILQEGHGKAIDYYGLGLLIYELFIGIPPFYKEDQEQMMNSILKDNLVLPQNLPREVRSLINGLLNKDPLKRLGNNGGFEEIKNSSWFSDIKWCNLENKYYEMQKPEPALIELFQMEEYRDSSKEQELELSDWSI